MDALFAAFIITIIFIFIWIGPYWLRKPSNVDHVNRLLLLEEQINDVSEWMRDLRDKRKSFRRRGEENLRVEAILTSTLRKAESLRKLKLRQHHRLWQPPE
jgi:hypothetical protein